MGRKTTTCKRNILKEGIDFVKMVRPKTGFQSRPVGLMRAIKKKSHEPIRKKQKASTMIPWNAQKQNI
jgi:hypothetical protein